MEQYKQEFIHFMLECNALTFGDFITKSGRKSPFFINAGNFKTGKELQKLGEFYAKAIHKNFPEQFDVLFGPAYKGIPLSVATAIGLSTLYNIDVAYSSNRKEIKDHGDKGILLGGKLKDKDKVIIIEDVTTAGTSIYETMPIIKAQGDITVIGLIISVDRMERGNENKTALLELKEKFNLKSCAIVTMKEIVEYLYSNKVDGRQVIDDLIKGKIDEYYSIYGVK
ncbi:MAG TPA: orotate phosphoribosyltransferase [Clostridiaceae bacterium]